MQVAEMKTMNDNARLRSLVGEYNSRVSDIANAIDGLRDLPVGYMDMRGDKIVEQLRLELDLLALGVAVAESAGRVELNQRHGTYRIIKGF